MPDNQKVLDDLLFQTLQLDTLDGNCRSITDRAAKLVLQGANPLAENEQGRTAFEIAVDHGRMSALTVMIKLANDLERHKAQQSNGLKNLIDDAHKDNGQVRKI